MHTAQTFLMDTDILIDNKDCLVGEDFLEQLLSNEYKWSSLLDTPDASPSEILADAAPTLMPPISPILSIKSSTSSSSDSGSEDDSKNNSSDASRLSTLSPIDWMTNFNNEPTNNLNLEDIELFLQKSAPDPVKPQVFAKEISPERNGPVVAIENGIIKGIKLEPEEYSKDWYSKTNKDNEYQQNSYFKVENENTSLINDQHIIVNGHIQFVVEQKIPSILKRTSSIVKPPRISVPIESTKGGKIAIPPLPHMKLNGAKDVQVKVPSSKSNVAINPKPVLPTNGATPQIVQNHVIPPVEADAVNNPTTDPSNFSESEIRAMKKQQRMIKNRESACQSRQKKKEYVSALEQRLLEAQQEIARLRLENKLLRDRLESGGRSRKVPRLDASLLIPKKNIAVIFAMVFMVSLNWNVLGWSAKPFPSETTPHRSTRHLLWSEDNPVDITNDDINNNTYMTDCQNATLKTTDFINQTESIRIAGELNRWIGGGKTLNWTYDVPRKKRQTYLSEEKINGDILGTDGLFNKLNLDANLVHFPTVKNNGKTVKEKSRLRRLRRNKDIDFVEHAVIDYKTLYRKPIRKSVEEFNMDDLSEWNTLLQALHRRDDTFYVVGVGKGEHLLVPAVSHNVTRPPKMALILPARTSNDSLKNDHVTLMQIDCSVINTSLVKLKSDALPESLRQQTANVGPEAVDEHNRDNATSSNKSNHVNVNSILRNSSHKPSKYTDKQNISHKEMGKDDLFAHYLFSKYEDSKEGLSRTEQKNIGKSFEKQMSNDSLSST